MSDYFDIYLVELKSTRRWEKQAVQPTEEKQTKQVTLIIFYLDLNMICLVYLKK